MFDRVQDVKLNIAQSDWTPDELLDLNAFIVKQIRVQQALVAQQMKRTLFVGTTVNFEDNDGVRVTGTVKKIMRKFAQVSAGTTTWRVPLNRLTKGAA